MPYRLLKPDLGTRLDTVDSTNRYLRLAGTPPGSWVSAQNQTQGKGRGHNNWLSLGDQKLFFSGKVQFPESHASLTLFSLFMGSAIVRTALEIFPELDGELNIKWPNDIYRSGKKVAGILIEAEYNKGIMELILGIGINYFGREIPESLQDKASFLLNRSMSAQEEESFLMALIENINRTLLISLEQNSVWKELEWIDSISFFKGKVLEWEDESGIERASYLGYDEEGLLILRTADGRKIELLDSPKNLRIL